ncbi:MAG: alpha/beta hydrolase [Dehalococcoidia bacterium]|nr:alpha/beta hydrolase [Dehalococcoidia bacterium]
MFMYVLVFAAVTAAGALVVLGALNYLAWSRTQVERLPVWQHPSDFNILHQDVAFPARGERLLLRGWYLPAGVDKRCVILVQGEGHHRNSPGIQALLLARDLTVRGYSVLLFDLRARGESQGARTTAGDRERRDVLGALDYVVGRGVPLGCVGLLGFSLGAAVAILVASREPGLRAVVSDSAFADLLEDLRHELVPGITLPRFLVGMLSAVGSLFWGAKFGAVRPIRAISDVAPRPLLFIHGTADDVISPQQSRQLAAAAAGHSELWLVEGAGHVGAYRSRPPEYVERVAGFFDRHLRAD